MTNSNKPPTRFGLESCQDMHEKLKWEADKLEKSWGVYDTFNFVVTAHHLYVDWIDSCGSPELIAKKSSLPDPAKKVMQAIADLVNGNKHYKLTEGRSLKRQVVTKVYKPIIGDYYAYFVAGPMVYVDFGDFNLSMMELMHQVLGYFEWLFKDGDITFPLALQNHLNMCITRPEKMLQDQETAMRHSLEQ